MGVQFGRWNSDKKPIDQAYLAKVKLVIAPYGPDGEGTYTISNLGILYCAFHTAKESHRETQPHITESGEVITWDGRLDNRAELIRELRNALPIDADDLSIVASAYQEWGTGCFAKLIGDWALCIWNAKSHSLILAKDPIGARHLYYSIEKDQVTWSTILDPLVLFADKSFALCEEYIAGWLSLFPATHLTPYVGIHSVPPSSFVRVRSGKAIVSKYWDFDPARKIRYRTDAEYENHFRAVFAEAVRRRLRSDNPVLAELSGGMDSSSIVCTADTLIARGVDNLPCLCTVSYYNDSEPAWNERPYFTVVERKRGRAGCHIDVSSQESFMDQIHHGQFGVTPGSVLGVASKSRLELAGCVHSHASRVLLSGIGGDEVLGGVPTPTPELQDLLMRARLRTLAHKLKLWALNKRRPWFHLLFEAVREFLPVPSSGDQPQASFLTRDFVQRNKPSLDGYERRLSLFGPLASFQHNFAALETLRRRLGTFDLHRDLLLERRYPYLDRDLLEFLFSIPRTQLVRPGHRRSLMRRALAGIVPDEVLNRKRKAFNVHSSLLGISAQLEELKAMIPHTILVSRGIVNAESFSMTLEDARRGSTIPVVALLRTFLLEAWLRSICGPDSMAGIKECPPKLRLNFESVPISAEKI